MHEGARYAQTLHRRNHLAPHQAAFAHSTYYEFTASLAGLRNDFDSLEETIARHMVGLI